MSLSFVFFLFLFCSFLSCPFLLFPSLLFSFLLYSFSLFTILFSSLSPNYLLTSISNTIFSINNFLTYFVQYTIICMKVTLVVHHMTSDLLLSSRAKTEEAIDSLGELFVLQGADEFAKNQVCCLNDLMSLSLYPISSPFNFLSSFSYTRILPFTHTHTLTHALRHTLTHTCSHEDTHTCSHAHTHSLSLH